LQLPLGVSGEVDPNVTRRGIEQRILHVEHVEIGPAVARETRGENQRHSRRFRETEGGQDGSRWNHRLADYTAMRRHRGTRNSVRMLGWQLAASQLVPILSK
jgi:hypothetical protein